MAYPVQVDDPHLRHLFDVSEGAGLEQEGAIRLTAGAPGPTLLRACADTFEQAAKHNLVRITAFLSFPRNSHFSVDSVVVKNIVLRCF